ncbi:hypothetical protein AB1K70_03640 [Bremerella sp. JC770]|uniref:hypothetical protein n=1 Tax=Bremerella sp. JC770 TaxID=3232137 RepID=UPI0034576FE4
MMDSEFVDRVPGECPVESSLTLGVILRRLLVSFFAWSIHLGVTFALIGFFGSIIPLYRETFEHFQLELPVITEEILQWSTLISNRWYLFVFAAIVANAPIAIGVCYLPRAWRWVTWVWFAGYLLFAIIVLLYAAIGLAISVRDLVGPQNLPT